MRVWIPDRLGAPERKLLEELLVARGHLPSFSRVEDQAEVLLTGGPALPENLVRRLLHLKLVVRFARPPQGLAQEETLLQQAGISYRTAFGSAAAPVAEHTVLLMLAMLRRLPEALPGATSPGAPGGPLPLGVRTLSEVTVGLIGLGAVGRRVAWLLKPFGGRAVYWKPHPISRAEEEALGVSYVDFQTLLETSDMVSLHARPRHPGAPLLSRFLLSALRRGTILINTGEEGLVDKQALFEAATEGHLAAALDTEPGTLAPGRPIPPNVLLTPRIAGHGQAALRAALRQACEAITPHAPELRPGPPRAVSPAPLGRVGARVLEVLGPGRPLAGCTVAVSTLLGDTLPALGAALAGLGCERVTWEEAPSPHLAIHRPDWSRTVLVELPGEGEASSRAYTTARVPALGFVLERWLLDHALWSHLLPREASGSLPGKTLLVHGYGARGRLVAWRARELGMNVWVREEEPRRALEALHDGFELAPQEVRAGTRILRTEGAPGGPEELSLLALRPRGLVPEGIKDELTALALIAASTASAPELEPSGFEDTCDGLLLEALLAARSPRPPHHTFRE